MDETKKVQERVFAELDSIEQKTTDKKILKAIKNIRKIIKS